MSTSRIALLKENIELRKQNEKVHLETVERPHINQLMKRNANLAIEMQRIDQQLQKQALLLAKYKSQYELRFADVAYVSTA